MGSPAEKPYLAALRFRWLTPWYDLLVRWTLPEDEIRGELIRRADVRPGDHVLDLGCGTGTLALMIKRARPAAEVWGVDADRGILDLAALKGREAGLPVTWLQGDAARLALPDASMDRVVSSLVFHHLTRSQKTAALAEGFRVLRPGGKVWIADWGRPSGLLMRAAFQSVRLLDGFETTADSVQGALPGLLASAGFGEVVEGTPFDTVFGTLRMHGGVKPLGAGRH